MLSDPNRIRTLVAEAGFVDVTVDAPAEPMYFGPDPDDATRFITGQFVGMLAEPVGPALPTTQVTRREMINTEQLDPVSEMG